jgi:hypothetical protein
MSPIEDEIRAALRSEASSLREVAPLSLPAALAPGRSRPLPRAWRAGWGEWLVPVAVAAVVVLVAAGLVAVKSLGNGSAGPAASSSPIAGPALAADAAPRYYVYVGEAKNPATGKLSGPAVVVGDRLAGKPITAYQLPDAKALSAKAPALSANAYGLTYSDTVSGAADDRTFVVSDAVRGTYAAIGQGPGSLPPAWYLVRIFPGSADPVRVTALPIQFPAGERISGGPSTGTVDGGPYTGIALSGDGTELAVVGVPQAGSQLVLQVYSVATGQLQHSWPTGVNVTSSGNIKPISGLSWVGDRTLGFTLTKTPGVSEEVRTLDVTTAGGNLLADSRVVWSQDVPAKPPDAQLQVPGHACDTPVLTGNGQAVVCGNSTYSGPGKRLTAVWLAYPLATPTKPRVIGSFREPANITAFYGSIAVDWTNPSGTEVISSWEPWSVTGPGANGTYRDDAVIGGGAVRQFSSAGVAVFVAW